MPRRVFDKDFKVAAVKLILEDEMDVKTVSQQLDIHANSLYRWVSEYEKYGKEAFPGNGTRIYDYQAEIHRLNRRNRELEEELDLLKKFRVFLKKKSK
ncbi:MAG: transposase [Sphaerochaetaceae bacterium]|nr:transposase [Sphaerochaetaceae bacterium]